MKKVKVICMALLAVIAMASCRGPRGPEGPAGPAGQDGNANVVSSTVTVYPNNWYFDNNTSWRVDIEYKAIDADIHDYGAVLVYMNQETPGVSFRLPSIIHKTCKMVAWAISPRHLKFPLTKRV